MRSILPRETSVEIDNLVSELFLKPDPHKQIPEITGIAKIQSIITALLDRLKKLDLCQQGLSPKIIVLNQLYDNPQLYTRLLQTQPQLAKELFNALENTLDSQVIYQHSSLFYFLKTTIFITQRSGKNT